MGGRGMRSIIVLAALLAAAPAYAEERDYCPARPGFGTPPCTIAPGRISAEAALADWTVEDTVQSRTDTVATGNTLVRIGVTNNVEVEIGWTPYGHVRTRDKTTRAITNQSGIGDVFLGAKFNLRNPDGGGFSIAALPFGTAPTGGSAIGAGDWGAGFLLPMSLDIGHSLSLQLTPEVDAAVNSGGPGRHLAYSAVVGLGFPIVSNLDGTLEFKALQDNDPSGATTQTFASASMAWSPSDRLQLDVGGAAGLNRNSATAELYMGISRRF